MQDWGLLWKRICNENGKHIQAFINFWAIASLPPLAMDLIEGKGKDLLWNAFINRKDEDIYQGTDEIVSDSLLRHWQYARLELGNGPDGHGLVRHLVRYGQIVHILLLKTDQTQSFNHQKTLFRPAQMCQKHGLGS